MRLPIFMLALGLGPVVWAEGEPVTAQATASADFQSAACEQAFQQAREEAIRRMDAAFVNQPIPESSQVELRSRTDERLGENEVGLFECRVTGTWAALPVQPPEDEQPDTLIGTVQSINEQYRADCRATDNGAACRRTIENRARADLLDVLVADHDVSPDGIYLEADGFEGSQSYNYQGRNLTLTMDGDFYFIVREASAKSPITDPGPPTGTKGEIRLRDEREPRPDRFTDNLDFTFAYTWDRNDGADEDELAISTNRWSLGLWVNNRFGFSAFWGEEEAGIADTHGRVHHDGGHYDVQGIGIGYRVFDNRAVTLENMVHFVDAQPFQATLDPGCSGCTPRVYEAENYYQATVNLKTNTEGLNIGWMLTWKLRDDLSNYNSLSSGWYVELQF